MLRIETQEGHTGTMLVLQGDVIGAGLGSFNAPVTAPGHRATY